eukprot:185468-Chlamydomonas_euryale.AAC.5
MLVEDAALADACPGSSGAPTVRCGAHADRYGGADGGGGGGELSRLDVGDALDGVDTDTPLPGPLPTESSLAGLAIDEEYMKVWAEGVDGPAVGGAGDSSDGGGRG